jgi:hypothetical protein
VSGGSIALDAVLMSILGCFEGSSAVKIQIDAASDTERPLVGGTSALRMVAVTSAITSSGRPRAPRLTGPNCERYRRTRRVRPT